MQTLSNFLELASLSETDAVLAQESGERLALLIEEQDELSIQVKKGGKKTEKIVVPTSACRVFVNVLFEMAKGNAVTVVPVDAELTTQQAANYLNISRPFLVRLLDDEKIPCRKVGKHRRILFQDLQRYKEKDTEERLRVLSKLTEQAQELDMGY